MLIPKYRFTNDYTDFYDYFLTQPHIKKSFKPGEYLWEPGEYLKSVYYIKSGIAKTLVTHEDGHQKIFLFSGAGTVFPGCHQSQFKIEKSLVMVAISEMDTLEFQLQDFYRMFQENSALNERLFETYAAFINLLIFESAHQEYNTSFMKLCNLLYLFSQNASVNIKNRIPLSQENIAEILTINRVNVAKFLSQLRKEEIIISHRKWIEIVDMDALIKYCSQETLLAE